MQWGQILFKTKCIFNLYNSRNISLLLILMKNIQRKVVETYLRLDKFSNATLILVLAPF